MTATKPPAIIAGVFVMLMSCFSAAGDDWPMWRYDAQRSAASPEELPSELHLQWVRQYSPRVPVWEDPLNRDLMRFDRAFEPVVAGQLLFVGFNDSDKVVALDTATGDEEWRFYAEGPVRFPPVVWRDRLFFVSDDGFLYCLDAKKGRLLWKLRGGPEGRRILGNSRLISTWPARGGPVVHDGTVYFAAGIWPFMGTFIYAVDAETGDVVWLNDSDGSTFQQQPHGGALSFGGVGPQGAFVVSGDKLLVPGGRSVPAVLDRLTGEVLHYRFNDQGKTGGAFVCADEQVFFNHHRERVVTMYEVATGQAMARSIGEYPVVTDEAYFVPTPSASLGPQSVRAFDAPLVRENPDRWQKGSLWELEVDASGDLIKAGRHLYAGGDGRVTAVALPGEGGVPQMAWTAVVDGKVERLVAANGMLFAVTLDGKVIAFGPDKVKPRYYQAQPGVYSPPSYAAQRASEILARTGVSEGYALVYGAGDGDLVEALAVGSTLRIIAFDADERRVEELRDRFDAAGLSGGRVALLQGDPLTAGTPPYLASLTVVMACDEPLSHEVLRRVYDSMRPYGGKAWIGGATESALAGLAAESAFAGLTVLGDELIAREGPLDGSATWTHLLGDIAQSGKSNDRLVRLPLGVLWFGGSSNENVLTRHGHGPPEQVVDGRLFIEGMTSMTARDVYTGRVLWEAPLHDLGTYGVYFDGTYKDTPTDPRYNQVHIPGANTRGTNFVVAQDGLYVIQGGSVSVLDPVTGKTLRAITLPPVDPNVRRPKPPPWGYIGVYEDLLIAGAGYVAFSDLVQAPKAEYSIWQDFDTSASAKFMVMDRHSGEIHWEVESEHGFLHNGTVAGNGLLFSLDKLPPGLEGQLRRRGRPVPESYRVVAYRLDTGEPAWESREAVFGSFLCYSIEHDVLLQSTRPSGDSMPGEDGSRLVAYRGKDGTILWDHAIEYKTFPLLHGDRFITESGVRDLRTGEPVLRPNPLTGEKAPWGWARMYGCNYPIASEYLLTFRSGAAGYYDLAGAGGTGNFGGFKSGCTSNLVAADGVLNAPDYTRTCSCPYQNQTSLAFVHTPDVETWTFNAFDLGEAPIKRVGVNLGAPGDRADGDTLWLEYPAVGGPSPTMTVATSPEEPDWYRHHSHGFTHSDSEGASDGLPWVAASGVEGLATATILLRPGATDEKPYAVRLHFAEPDEQRPGDRVFDVALQRQPALTQFDVVAEAGGVRRSVVREFPGVAVKDELRIDLRSATGSTLLCGVEIVAEGW